MIEDNCESLGSKYKNKYLGSFGDFSSFSFYYSHQVTSGEGGMIACKTKDDYLLLKTLRAHGWDRDIQKERVNKKFNFINSGFNLKAFRNFCSDRIKSIQKTFKNDVHKKL